MLVVFTNFSVAATTAAADVGQAASALAVVVAQDVVA